MAALLAIFGALVVCCAGPTLLLALVASAGAWFLHAGGFMMGALGATAALIAAGLARRSRLCAGCRQQRWPAIVAMRFDMTRDGGVAHDR